MRRLITVAVGLCLLAGMVGCGQKGDLYFPKESAAAAQETVTQ